MHLLTPSLRTLFGFALGVACWTATPFHARGSEAAGTSVPNSDPGHWAYRPLMNPRWPEDSVGPDRRNAVDRFVMARLEAAGLRPALRAGEGKLVRRIHFDLTGLPPTPEEVDSFASEFGRDPEAAVSTRVDRLLASEHHGERWARHWLDVVRYADSDGQEGDRDRPTAHHFRDFVIRALNADLPFDTFVRWQLAGDELEPDNVLALAATGFIAAGPHAELPDRLMEEERLRTRFNELDDMLSTTGSAMLGLTLACARCHDHKYDPVPRRDYYRMLSAFNGGDRAQLPLASLAEVKRQGEVEAAWKTGRDAVKARLDERVKVARITHGPVARRVKIAAAKLTDAQKALLTDMPDSSEAKALAKSLGKPLDVADRDLRDLLSAEERAAWESDEKELAEWEARRPKPLPTALGFADFGPDPRETFLLARGDFRARSEPVELGFLSTLTRGGTPADFWTKARRERRRDDSTQQRRALAEWMTDLDYGAGALVARVIVNRVWQHHFGQGLVRTVNDFGARSDPPTHPELLEWLAHEFVRGGWKLKPLHRLIMTSATYLQDTGFEAEKAKVDPENRLLWRRRPMRIESEILRDAMLATSGTLNREMYGPAVKAPIAPEAMQARNMKDPYPKDVGDTPATRRRSVYLFHKRVVQNPLLQAFDGPDASASCGRRENTTVAPQALALMNDRFVRARALDFARRVEAEAGAEWSARVDHVWRLALGRQPAADERAWATAFGEGQVARRARHGPDQTPVEIRREALADLCQAIFASNEFIYVD